jgi:23S rRNA (adenine2030-N6)-methyltransferase
LNYRHAFHAGSHADVMKHAALALVIGHLKQKDKAFAVLDAHAGIGVYDLAGAEAARTGEWQSGVGRLYDAAGRPLPLASEAEALLRPWREVVAAVNRGAGLSRYPGSPEVARRLMRPGDRLVLNELHPADHRTLARRYAGQKNVRVLKGDADAAIRAGLPFPQRRGLVLIDPSYEQPGDIDATLAMLADGYRRFQTGIFMLWYPLTGDRLAEKIIRGVRRLALPKTLRVELTVRRVIADGGLAGSGLVIVNPPWQLDRELAVLLPELARRLKQESHAGSDLAWLSPESVA